MRYVLLWCCLLGVVRAADAEEKSRLNVLLICVDDLRPQLGCYGHDFMKTPHMDRLATQGRLFTRHYAAVPTCGASRYALLTGRRPSRTQALGNDAFKRLRTGGEVPLTLPAMFRQQGYRTVCIGKVSHHPDGLWYGYDDPINRNELEMPGSWDVVGLPYGRWSTGWNSFFAYADGTGRPQRKRDRKPYPPFESADVPDEAYPDGLIAADAVNKLAALRNGKQPFFLAVGFFKPHLPLNAPKKYWDLYDEKSIDLSPCPKAPAPINNSWSLHNSGEFYNYTTPEGARGDDAYKRKTRHAYYAAVSYADAQIGKVLDAVDRLGLRDDTIVVVWGDHGWHLGDLTIWGKHTLYEWALRSTLIVRTPRMKSPGRPAEGLVESLDLYPTLTDLCEVTLPDDLDGVSLRPLLDDPDHPGLDAAFGYYDRGGGGVSMRTDRYRITYFPKQHGKLHAVELYDHQTDPYETTNIAAERPQLAERLLGQLKADSPKLAHAP
jgi:arylsulfatase A-like enzyme